MSEKKTVAKALSLGENPIRAYSAICVSRNVRPMAKVSTRPALSPARLPRLIDVSAQCIVKLDVTRIAVLIPATKTGRCRPGVGHGSWLTTRMKK